MLFAFGEKIRLKSYLSGTDVLINIETELNPSTDAEKFQAKPRYNSRIQKNTANILIAAFEQ